MTSGYHMARSLTELSRAMPDVELIAHPVLPTIQHADARWISPASTRLLVLEYLKLLPALARLGAARVFGTAPTPAIAAVAFPNRQPAEAALD